MKLLWIGRIVSAVAGLPLLMSAAMKLTQSPQVLEGMAHLGMPESLILTLGILEAGCVLLYLLPWTSFLGGILLTGYMGGAILAHLRLGEAVYTQIGLGVLIWFGLFLQDARLRQMIPLRRK